MLSFILFKLNISKFSIIQFHYALTTHLYEEKLHFNPKNTSLGSHENNHILQGLKFIIFTKTWQLLKNGLITVPQL